MKDAAFKKLFFPGGVQYYGSIDLLIGELDE
jgi:hypothetical protein